MSGSFPKKSRHQLTGPTLSQDSSEDWALWRLSLVLKEIAEKQETGTEKTEPQHQVDVEGTVSGDTD